jgi:hypothetical protein
LSRKKQGKTRKFTQTPFSAYKLQKKLDRQYPHDIESGCTIVLLGKKIKKFICIASKHLSIFATLKIGHFRMRDASSCKG